MMPMENAARSAEPVAISVVLCTFNRADRLALVLEDLERQRIEPGTAWEVIVVDNNSTDRTRAVVAAAIERGKIPLTYLFEATQGLSCARNAGIDAARGELIAFTDDDVRLPEDWLAVTVRSFREFDCLAVGGRVLPTWTVPQPPWLLLEGPYRMVGVVTYYDRGHETRFFDKTMFTPIGANMAFRREAFERYGRFRTDIGRKGDVLLSGEDYEFAQRLQGRGERILYQARSTVFHPVDPQRLSRQHFRKWYYYNGRSRSKVKNYASGPFGIPKRLLRDLVRNAWRCLLASLRMARHEAFYYQLQICFVLGKLDGQLRRRGVEDRSR